MDWTVAIFLAVCVYGCLFIGASELLIFTKIPKLTLFASGSNGGSVGVIMVNVINMAGSVQYCMRQCALMETIMASYTYT